MRSLAGLIVGPSVPGARGQAYSYVLKHVFLFHLVPHRFRFWPKLPQNPASVWMLRNSLDWLLPRCFQTSPCIDHRCRVPPEHEHGQQGGCSSRPFRKNTLPRKCQQDAVQTSSCLRDLARSLVARSGMVFWKVFYLKEVTDTWISALPTYVRGFPEEQTCSLY